ncbi:hypothetical protein [Aliagarivorans taiwanensis]|uniref:hypothetical protein n=1 Tax=Aliagarivorans taiwanensis TaxID=561966 RepID=UPI0004150E55|nr:hypothetical protein [Aliagarivorans taiwanensis]
MHSAQSLASAAGIDLAQQTLSKTLSLLANAINHKQLDTLLELVAHGRGWNINCKKAFAAAVGQPFMDNQAANLRYACEHCGISVDQYHAGVDAKTSHERYKALCEQADDKYQFPDPNDGQRVDCAAFIDAYYQLGYVMFEKNPSDNRYYLIDPTTSKGIKCVGVLREVVQARITWKAKQAIYSKYLSQSEQ